jgi:DNA-binding PadR family transcriptional regulator
MNAEQAVKKYVPMTDTMFHILLVLNDQMHGYAITKKVSEITNGRLALEDGTIYSSLAKLHRDGLIEELPAAVERRRVYRITDVGRTVIAAECDRLMDIVSAVTKYMSD